MNEHVIQWPRRPSAPTVLGRRWRFKTLFTAAVLAPALLSLSGCEQPTKAPGGSGLEAPSGPGSLAPRAFEDSCPEDPKESGGVTWAPDVLHPVFWGYSDLDVADGAPGPLRVYYPSHDGSPPSAAILKMCLVRYPVVLFLHGRPLCGNTQDYYKRWDKIGMVLARSGYVVVAPKHDPTAPDADQSAEVALSLNALDWVRDKWEHRQWVDPRPEATAVVGHSWGALLASRVRQARPTISAYAGLSGPWQDYADPQPNLAGIAPPSFFMWGTSESYSVNLGTGALWNVVPFGKTQAAFKGNHFDYLDPKYWQCPNVPQVSCSLTDLAAADLVALFVSRHVPGSLSTAHIPPSLIPPPVTLTFEQQFFAGGHLQGIAGIETKAGCGIDLKWEDPDESSSRHLGP
jgi:pimeloyl-ACP methyl ester carboxylesterase